MSNEFDMSADMTALQYPIGKRAPPPTYSSESRRAVIGDLAELPVKIRQAVAGLTDAQLDTAYRPGGWTVRQVVHHVADAHLILYTRAKIALTEKSPPVKVWEEIPWAELPDAREMPIEDSLTILSAVHSRFVYLLQRLTPDHLTRTMQHPAWGTIPIDELIDLCAWHGKHHTAHVTGLRERRGW